MQKILLEIVEGGCRDKHPILKYTWDIQWHSRNNKIITGNIGCL